MASQTHTDEELNPTQGSPYVVIAVIVVVFGFGGLLTIAAFLWNAAERSAAEEYFRRIDETIPVEEPSEEVLQALIVLDGATSLRRDPGAYGSYHVAYGLTARHPADSTIEQISSRLEALGWTPLKDDWLNPGLPSSHVDGWGEFLDATRTPRQRVHQWIAQWQDNSGNIVDYTFRYSYRDHGKPNLTSLWVNGSWYPAAGVKIMQTPTR